MMVSNIICVVMVWRYNLFLYLYSVFAKENSRKFSSLTANTQSFNSRNRCTFRSLVKSSSNNKIVRFIYIRSTCIYDARIHTHVVCVKIKMSEMARSCTCTALAEPFAGNRMSCVRQSSACCSDRATAAAAMYCTA